MENISKLKKYAFYPLVAFAVIGYLANYITSSVSLAAGETSPIVTVAQFLQPYGFLCAVLAALCIYSPHKTWKKIVIFVVILFAFVSITIGVNTAFLTINALGFIGILAYILMQKPTNKALIFSMGAGLVFTAAMLLSGLKLNEYFTDIAETKAFALVVLGLFVLFAFPQTQLWKKVIVGLILGVLLGFDLKSYNVEYFTTYLKLLGTIFLNLIYMIIAPLIFFSLVSGINNVNDSKSLGRIGTKATLVYGLTAMMSVALGLIIANMFNLAEGIDMESIKSATAGGDDDAAAAILEVADGLAAE